MTTHAQHRSEKLQALGQLLTGAILGVALTLGGFALAGKLRPPDDPEVLVALAQTIDTTDKQVDVMLARGDVGGAIAALEQLRATNWPSRDRGGDAGVQLRHDAYGRLLRLRLEILERLGRDDDALLVYQQALDMNRDLLDEVMGGSR